MKKLTILVTLLIFATPPALASAEKELCSAPVSIACLKGNFVSFYQQDYDRFFTAFRKFEAEAAACTNEKATADFLDLASCIGVNAEVSEAYARTAEKLLIKKPSCFFEAANLLENRSLGILVKQYLQTPIFHDETTVRKIMQNYRKNVKYDRITSLYFSK